MRGRPAVRLATLRLKGRLMIQGNEGVEGMQSGIVYNIQRMSTQDGPGMRTTVFLKGCPLHCSWCSNPESQSFQPQLLVFDNLCRGCGKCMEVCPHGAVIKNGERYGRDASHCRDCGVCATTCPAKARIMSGTSMTVEEVMQVVRKDSLFYGNSGGGVTFGGGEPTSAGEFLIALLQACRHEGYHTCVDTCGHCAPGQFKKVLDLAELLLFDCKHMNPEQHRRLTGQDNGLIIANLREAMRASVPVRIRVPLMPGLNDSDDNIAAMAALLHEFDRRDVDVLPCHAFGKSKYAALGHKAPDLAAYEPNALKEVLDRFRRHDLNITIV